MMNVMLAGKVEEDKLRFPLLGSVKLDGVRAKVEDSIVLSRSNKPIPNEYVQKLYGNSKFEGLDSELMVGSPTASDVFRNTTSGVMSMKGEPEVVMHVFDSFRYPKEPFTKRLEIAREQVEGLLNAHIVEHVLIESLCQMEEFELQSLELGYEGIMLRSMDGPYKNGRSTTKEGYLLKVKRFLDSEALIVGFVEQLHNANEAVKDERGFTKRSHHKANMLGKGTLGALQVKDLNTGTSFDLGTGFDDAEKQRIWNNRDSMLNKVVKYKYFPTGSKEKPRLPVFLGYRAPFDM